MLQIPFSDSQLLFHLLVCYVLQKLTIFYTIKGIGYLKILTTTPKFIFMFSFVLEQLHENQVTGIGISP